MKAILLKKFGGAEEMYLGETHRPIISEEEVLVKIHATALNRADLLQRRGLYPASSGESEIMGLEMAGEIVETGGKTGNWKVGNRVFALLAGGGYASYVKVHKDMLIPIPNGMGYIEAAAIAEAYLTAYQAVIWLAKLEKGETILIHAGASGVGTAAIQLAKNKWAKVIVTASLSKHEICKQLGADICIDYKTEIFDEVVFLQNKNGVRVVIDFIGGPYFTKNLKVLSQDGRMVMLGFLGGGKITETNLYPILSKRLNIMGSTLRARSLSYKTRLTKDFATDCLPLFENGQLKPVVDSVFNWKEVQKAHAYMEADKNKGKIILQIIS